MQPLLQCVEIGVGFGGREPDGGNAKPSEMGDASVPFPFDVHVLISTSDAPTLESSLHKHFGERRVNLENERKEFFNVTIEELKLGTYQRCCPRVMPC